MSITNTAAPSTPVSFETLLAKMLPHFKFFARKVQKLKADNFDDAIQDLTAIALTLYQSLVRRGKEAFYSPIMKYSIQRYKSGRYFTGTSSKDVLADQTRILGRCEICSLNQLGTEDNSMVDEKSDVADGVAFKIDFHETWLANQTPRDQRIIHDLTLGHSPSAVARRHNVSPAYISQSRRRYGASWDDFIGDAA
jgi:hypothetical protein